MLGRTSFLDRVISSLYGPQGSEPGWEVLRLLVFVWGFVLIGLCSLGVPALARCVAGAWQEGLNIVGVGLFLAGAAVAVGSLFGFLFGVPKVKPDLGADGKPSTGDEPAYTPNTNLESISDWLTKLIVGVGLVQIRELSAWFAQVAELAGAAMGSGPSMKAVAGALIIHNLLMGFFQGFLVSYLYLGQVFSSLRVRSAQTGFGQDLDPASSRPTVAARPGPD